MGRTRADRNRGKKMGNSRVELRKLKKACKLPCLSREVRCRCRKKAGAIPKVLGTLRSAGQAGHRRRSNGQVRSVLGLAALVCLPVWRVGRSARLDRRPERRRAQEPTGT